MRFPNAYKGVKKLFIAEIISIAVALVGLVAAILATVNVTVAAGTLALVSGVAMIVVFIIQLIGLIQGARDSSFFRIGLWLTLFGILFSLLSSIFQTIEVTKVWPTIVFSALDAAASVCNLLVVVSVLYGIAGLAEELRNKQMADKGHTLANFIVFLYILAIILGFLPGLTWFNLNDGWRIAFLVVGILAAVIELVIYINVVIYLYRATKMLQK